MNPFETVFQAAASHANGHGNCRAILKAISDCRKWLAVAQQTKTKQDDETTRRHKGGDPDDLANPDGIVR